MVPTSRKRPALQASDSSRWNLLCCRYGARLIMLIATCAAAGASGPMPAAAAEELPAHATAATAAPPPKQAVPPSLADIITALEALDTTEHEIDKRVADDTWLGPQSAEIDADEQALDIVRRPADDAALDLVEIFALTDQAAKLRAADRRLTTTIETLGVKTRALDADLDRLAAYSADAAQWRQAARARSASADLIARIEAVPERNDRLAQAVRAKRDQALELLSRAARLSAQVNALRSRLTDRRLQLEAQMSVARDEPLWRIGGHRAPFDGTFEVARIEASHIATFLAVRWTHVCATAVAAFALAFLMITAAGKQLARAEVTGDREASTLFQAPGTAAILLTMIALVWLGPAGPAWYYEILFSLMPIPAALLGQLVFAHRASLSLFTLTVALVSLGLVGPIVDPFPLERSLLLIAQCLAVGVALAIDLRRGALTDVGRWSAMTTRRVTVSVIVLLALPVLAAVVGYTGPARVLRNVVLGTAGLGVLIFVAAHLLYGLTVALFETRIVQRLRIVSQDTASARRAALTAIRIAGWTAWALGMLVLVGRLDWVEDLAAKAVDLRFTIGATTVSSAAILVGLAVLAGTYVLVRMLRLLLDIELLPRLRLEHGVAFAVSAVIRYGLIAAGVLLAMAAMGIDFTKVTLLAGAIGVGVGLGLQGVVNNVVSGLILLVERPITAGDTVQIGDSRGVVQSIGLRASTIRTAQGAEVIIPNADLVAKAVTNWTLSDGDRSIDIDVDVPREADPKTVIGLLERAAAAVQGIKPKPAPRAWLNSFGADRTYRLQAWIDAVERSTEVQGALRMAIAKTFGEAGVEVK